MAGSKKNRKYKRYNSQSCCESFRYNCARGYYLITSKESPASGSADKVYSTSNHIAANNTVLLFSDAGTTLVDKLGLGTAQDNETASFTTNPTAGQSVIRKAFSNSTAISLAPGGADVLFGNGFDTDDNATDFVLLTSANPRNASSPAAELTPTPTIATPTPTPTLTPTPTPTSEIIVNEPVRPGVRFICEQTNHVITIAGFHFSIPSIQCHFVRE